VTHAEFACVLKCLGWSLPHLALLLGCEATDGPRCWVVGAEAVPQAVATWLTWLRAAHDALPPPVEWRT